MIIGVLSTPAYLLAVSNSYQQPLSLPEVEDAGNMLNINACTGVSLMRKSLKEKEGEVTKEEQLGVYLEET